MREKRQHPLQSVLALTFGALLIAPLAASAASGLPATITMQPGSASPGTQVEVVGLDFPASASVELQLTTTAGAVHLATATTEEGGYFRQLVRLPADVAPGFWELSATAQNGTAAAHIFEAGEAAPVAVAVEPTSVAPVESNSSNSGSNALVLLVLLGLVASIGGAAAFVYYQTHRTHTEPGMSVGEDPIWGGAPSDP